LTTTSKLTSAAFAVLVLSTALAHAGPIDGHGISVTPSTSHVDSPTIDVTPKIDAPVLDVSKPKIDFDGNLLGAPEPQLRDRRSDAVVALGCEIAGGDDLLLVNNGNTTLIAGTAVKWQLKGTGQQGYFALNADLSAGQAFKAVDVVEEGAADMRCMAKVV
jgi:hypothetical protein